MYLQCYTLEEIADKSAKPRQTVTDRLDMLKNEILQNPAKPPENLQKDGIITTHC